MALNPSISGRYFKWTNGGLVLKKLIKGFYVREIKDNDKSAMAKNVGVYSSPSDLLAKGLFPEQMILFKIATHDLLFTTNLKVPDRNLRCVIFKKIFRRMQPILQR